MSNTLRLAKFEKMVKDIDETFKNSVRYARCYTGRNNALTLIFDENCLNDYSKIIINNSSLSWPTFRWKGMYGDESLNFNDEKSKLDALVLLVDECDDCEVRYMFVFWSLFVAMLEKADDSQLSLICDFAQMTHITEDEFFDIILCIKWYCHIDADFKEAKTLNGGSFDGVWWPVFFSGEMKKNFLDEGMVCLS